VNYYIKAIRKILHSEKLSITIFIF